MFKGDIFIPKPRAFDQVQLQRRTKQVIATDPEHEAYVASAEDTILAKLERYRLLATEAGFRIAEGSVTSG